MFFLIPPFKNSNEKSPSDQGLAFVINASKSIDGRSCIVNSFCEYFSSIIARYLKRKSILLGDFVRGTNLQKKNFYAINSPKVSLLLKL